MSKVLTLMVVCVMMTGCAGMQPKDILKGANAIKNLNKISNAGVQEEFVTGMKNVFDPSRGGGVK